MKLQFSSILAAAAVLSFASTASQAGVVFDNISAYEAGTSGAVVSSTSSTPNTFMGDGYTLAAGTTTITGFDLFPVNLSGTAYTGLKLNVYVWGTVNTGTVSAATPAFSNLLTNFSVTSTGNFASGSFYSFESGTAGVPGISLTTPLAVTGSNIGLTINVQGTTDGVTYSNVNSLTSLISYGVPATVGSNMFNGYYRNAASETNGNFTSTLRSLGTTNQSLAVRIYGDVSAVPEASTWALMALGLAGVAFAARRRA